MRRMMIDLKTGEPHTAHTTNPVPFHLIDEDSIGVKLREGGALEDVAPTMLGLLGLEKPDEMTRKRFAGGVRVIFNDRQSLYSHLAISRGVDRKLRTETV